MDDPTVTVVLQRLARLEEARRRWKLLGIGTISVLALVVLLGAAGGTKVPEEIRAKQFVLVDQNGKIRAMLRSFENGSASLTVNDDAEKPRITMGVEGVGNPLLALIDRTGKDARVFLSMIQGVAAQGVQGVVSPSVFGLTIKGQAGKERIELAVTDGTPDLTLYDRSGQERATLRVDGMTGGTPRLNFFDKDGKSHSTSNTPARDSLLRAVPILYSDCLQRKQLKPNLDCSEYRRALELIVGVLFQSLQP
jgi:hypothetical protein